VDAAIIFWHRFKGTQYGRYYPALDTFSSPAGDVHRAPTHVQSSGAQKFQIRVTDPAYTGLPIWIYAELSSPLEIRYPYGEDPEDFGPNRLEVKRSNDLLAPVPFKPWVGRGGIVDGSIAPATSPTNRLPLHAQYSLDTAGVIPYVGPW